MDENTNPVAQGQPGQADGADQTSVQGNQETKAEAQFAGFQKRIDELTARIYDGQDAVAARDAQIVELTQRVLEMAAQPRQAEEPLPYIDPDVQRYADGLVGRRMKQLEDRFEGMMGKLNTQMAYTAVQQEIAKVGDERVAKRAQELVGAWTTRGLNGWTPADAVKYAAGEVALDDMRRNGKARNARGQFTGNDAVVVYGAAQPNVNPVQNGTPADIDSWPIEKQIQWYEKRLDGQPF